MKRLRAGDAVLWGKLAYTTVELSLGVALIGAAVSHHDLTGVLRNLAHRELREDPGDVTARHVLAWTHPVPLGREAVVGAAVAGYAFLKGGLVVAVLRQSRAGAMLAAALFVVITAITVIAVTRQPSPLRLLVALLDSAVSIVVVADARRLVKMGTRTHAS